MHPYINILNRYFEETPINSCCNIPSKLLELMFCCYMQHHNLDTPKTKACYHQLNKLLEQLSVANNDEVFNLVLAICDEYQKEAFQSGVAIGLRLYHELLQD